MTSCSPVDPDDDDRGSIAPAVIVIALFLFLLAGLVTDSARLLAARSRAVAYAEEAARAGAQGIQLDSEEVELNPKQVELAVDQYCRQAAAREPRLTACAAAPDPGPVVVVRTTVQIPTGVLGMVGWQTMTAQGVGRADSRQGVLVAGDEPGLPTPSRVVTQVPLPSLSTGTREPSPTLTPTPTTTAPTPTTTAPTATATPPTPTATPPTPTATPPTPTATSPTPTATTPTTP